MQTIAAISTPVGVGAISIVRMSGPQSLSFALRRFHAKALADGVQPNRMYLGRFAGDAFDEQCMMVYFAAPASYTGEDIVEFQLHGGVTVTDLVLRTLLSDGARPAEPGEFTKRAFLNGKLTLSQAEGIAAVIHAAGRASLNAAYHMMAGSLAERLRPTMDALQTLVATLSAALDYPDEMEDTVERDFAPTIEGIEADLATLAATAADGKLVRDGISIALIGTPNAGKSSLLNCILKEDRAIVTDIAGTTRDTLCESVSIDGVRLNLLDTAGLRQTTDRVEQIGVARAYQAADKADVVVYLLDATRGEQADEALLARFQNKHLYVVYNKTDVCAPCDNRYPAISARTGAGVSELLFEIAALAKVDGSVGAILTEDRHIYAVNAALKHVREAMAAYRAMPLDCVLVDLVAAYRALGEVDGATATDALLDQIFSRFCVGK